MKDKCWDCGSTISNRHTPLCAMAEYDDVCDLPAHECTQWWTGEIPSTTKSQQLTDS